MKKLILFLFLSAWIFTGFSLGDSDVLFSSGNGVKNAYGEGKMPRTGVFTAYTASTAQTDQKPRIMASGNKPYIGAAACPKYMEFGTRIRVQGMGEYTCEDRMHRRYRDKNRFDILMKDQNRAVDFGKKQLRYEIVNE